MKGFHPRTWFYRNIMNSVPKRIVGLFKRAHPLLYSFSEAKALFVLAKKNVGLGAIVELGSANGGSSCILSIASKEAGGEKVYCIDLWMEKGECGAEEFFASLDDFRKNVEKNGAPELVEPIKSRSVDAAKTWDKPIKLLFIDASHKCAAVFDDIKAWEPFLVKGGIIVFHDYGKEPGVTKAVNELIVGSGRFSKLKRNYSLAWAKKSR